MNGGRTSSWNESWNEANVVFLGATREKIDWTSGQGQCWSLLCTVNGGIHDGMSCEDVIKSMNGVDERSPPICVARCLTFLRHLLRSW